MAIIDFARDDPRMITANFGLAEFQCPPTCGCNAQLIDDDLIKRLQTIRDKLGGKIKITGFVRYEKGEGLEKREDNFADEVASMMK